MTTGKSFFDTIKPSFLWQPVVPGPIQTQSQDITMSTGPAVQSNSRIVTESDIQTLNALTASMTRIVPVVQKMANPDN